MKAELNIELMIKVKGEVSLPITMTHYGNFQWLKHC